jgi:hypothetical protein
MCRLPVGVAPTNDPKNRKRPRVPLRSFDMADITLHNHSQKCKSRACLLIIASAPMDCRGFESIFLRSHLFSFQFRSMFVSSIRSFAFVCLVCLSMVVQAYATCGASGHAKFNAVGTNHPQGYDGELYCAVRCILHNRNCATNSQGIDIYPTEAKGGSESDMSKLIGYYGSDISNWCVGLVKDFSYVFQSEVSNMCGE